jgi:hypothetical protein
MVLMRFPWEKDNGMPSIPPIDAYVFSDAIRAFWDTRLQQREEQILRGITDQGTRGDVTGGKQMNGFARIIVELIEGVGVPRTDIYIKGADLPGYFRPTKAWDIVVATETELLAAIELKSMVGSFGKNFNNRTEEALGNAVDLWTAYREGAFRASPQPWVGYLFVLQAAPESETPVGVRQARFPALPEFDGASYAKRYELLCQRLVLERHYSAACFLLTDPNKANQRENYVEPADDLSGVTFLSQLLRHVAR